MQISVRIRGKRLKSTASIGLVLVSWGQQEMVQTKTLFYQTMDRNKFGYIFLLTKIEIFVRIMR